ncbi:MAG: AMP-binding protein [Polyangiaceae bacterium]
METPLDFIYAHEKKHPDSVWLTQPMGDGTVRDFTWKQALDESRKMAAHLVSLDLPKSSQIALFAKNNAWWILADIAIWMAGHVTVPLYPTLAVDTIKQILEHSESRLIFIGKLDGFENMEPGIPSSLPRVAMPLAPANVDRAEKWVDIVAKTKPIDGNPQRDPDDLATIIYTSGSTGMAKGVMHSFKTMAAVDVVNHLVKVDETDRMLSYLPLAHAMERAVVEVISMNTGARIYFAESLDTFVNDLKRARPTVFISVPRLWNRFQQGVFTKMPPEKLSRLLKIPIVRGFVRRKILKGLGLDSVRYAISGSAPISADLLNWYRSLGLELLEGYGMSENFCISHGTRPGQVRVGYVGPPQEGCEQKIADDGEILVKSPATMLGYFKEKAMTDAAIDKEGFLHTGDRGELDELGRLKITGRVKEIFKTSKGKYVAPSPIENELMLHNDVEQALVAGESMPQPFGMVVLSDAARNKAKEAPFRDELSRTLNAHLEKTNARLSAHEQLEKIVVVREAWTIENGALTPTMKVKRTTIEKRYADKVPGWYAEKPRVVWE